MDFVRSGLTGGGGGGGSSSDVGAVPVVLSDSVGVVEGLLLEGWLNPEEAWLCDDRSYIPNI